jgi:hypothetical protein
MSLNIKKTCQLADLPPFFLPKELAFPTSRADDLSLSIWDRHWKQSGENLIDQLIWMNLTKEDKRVIEQTIEKIKASYVSFDQFFNSLQKSLHQTLEAIDGAPYGVIFQNGRDKSGAWIYGMLKEMLLPRAVRPCDNIMGAGKREKLLPEMYLDDAETELFNPVESDIDEHQLVAHWIFFDDASYSGQQLRSELKNAIPQLLHQIADQEISIHVCIPYMSQRASTQTEKLVLNALKKEAREWNLLPEAFEKVKILTHPANSIPTVSEIWKGDPNLTSIAKIFQNAIVKNENNSPIFTNITLTFFQHKVPDDRSLLRGITQRVENFTRDGFAQRRYFIQYPDVNTPYKETKYLEHLRRLDTEKQFIY